MSTIFLHGCHWNTQELLWAVQRHVAANAQALRTDETLELVWAVRRHGAANAQALGTDETLEEVTPVSSTRIVCRPPSTCDDEGRVKEGGAP